MKTKTLNIILLIILSINSFHCKKEPSISQIVNEKLEGIWPIDSWIVDGSVMSNIPNPYINLNFHSEENEKGIATWLSGWNSSIFPSDVSYKIINQGTEIDFDGDIFKIKLLTDKKLIIHGKNQEAFWKVEANRQ